MQPLVTLLHASHSPLHSVPSTVVFCAHCRLSFQGDTVTSLVYAVLPLANAFVARVVQTFVLCAVHEPCQAPPPWSSLSFRLSATLRRSLTSSRSLRALALIQTHFLHIVEERHPTNTRRHVFPVQAIDACAHQLFAHRGHLDSCAARLAARDTSSADAREGTAVVAPHTQVANLSTAQSWLSQWQGV